MQNVGFYTPLDLEAPNECALIKQHSLHYRRLWKETEPQNLILSWLWGLGLWAGSKTQ